MSRKSESATNKNHKRKPSNILPDDAKFVQIATAQLVTNDIVLYALDETGGVWWFDFGKNTWNLFDNSREY